MIAVLLLLAVSPDAAALAESTYSDEQIERCGANVEHVKKMEAKTFALPEDKAVAVNEARKYLRMCLEIAAAQPFDAAQRAARAKCPCQLADLEWTDGESKECRDPIEHYFRYGTRTSQPYVAAMIDDIRSCLLRSRAAHAHEKVEAEMTATMAAEPSAPASDPPIPRPDRRAHAAKRAARLEKQREIEAVIAKTSESFCGTAPERSAWDGIYAGLKRGVKSEAHDPDSIEFVGCTDLLRKNPPACWVTACRFRGKNAFGAMILQTEAFGKNKNGWYQLSGK